MPIPEGRREVKAPNLRELKPQTIKEIKIIRYLK